MLQIFSRWRCDNWVSVFKIIFASLGLLLYQNQKFHEQHDKNMYHPKNHPKNLWVCNRIWQVKKSWIIHPSILLHSQQQCCCKKAQKNILFLPVVVVYIIEWVLFCWIDHIAEKLSYFLWVFVGKTCEIFQIDWSPFFLVLHRKGIGRSN